MTQAAASAPVFPALRTAIRRHAKAAKFRFEPPRDPHTRQLLIDVSVVILEDVRTGIQRVVRALLGQLAAAAGPDLIVQPVFASRNHGYCRALLTTDGRVTNAGTAENVLQPVVTRSGDVFLGLDLAAHIVPHVEADLARWRRNGVTISFLVYDLLPVLQPNWFPPQTARKIDRWLRVLKRQADHCICISEVVATDLARELAARGSGPVPKITTIPLGSDLAASYPSQGLPQDIAFLREWMQDYRVILAVGTIEPRKGYQQLLDAFVHHWTQAPDSNIALLIVGRPGWKTDKLQAQLRTHEEQGKRLLWLDGVSDELLAEIYQGAAGLVAASHAEGFGLPLIEALAYRVPVLARDIMVFREIGGTHFDYFTDDAPEALGDRLQGWMDAKRAPSADTAAALPRWADSAETLMRDLKLVAA